MYRNTFQKDYFTIFYSTGLNPTANWAITTNFGYAKRVFDEDIRALVMEIRSNNVSITYMNCPCNPKVTLGIKLPFLVLLVKNLCKYFTFEVKVMDDQRFPRRFRIANFQTKTTVKTFCTAMPMCLSPGWNQINFNLADFCRRAYGTNYVETMRVQIHANVRVRRVYFTDRLVTEEELPNEYRLVPQIRGRTSQGEYTVPVARPPSPAKSAASTDNILNELATSADEATDIDVEKQKK